MPSTSNNASPGKRSATPSTAPSPAPSTPVPGGDGITPGQAQRTRGRQAFDNPSPSPRTWKGSTGVRRAEVLIALGVFQRATADQLWRMLRPGNSHDRLTRDTLNDLKHRGMVRVETTLPDNRKLWVLTERGHKEARQLLPNDVRLSALRKLELDADGNPVSGEGFGKHALAVTSTAALLTGAGLGTVLSWQTEVAHKLPYGFVQYADLVVRAPDSGVPVMLLEVDRLTESVDDLVAKVRRYDEWFGLLAPKADPVGEKAARHRGGAVHGFRLWSRIYPPTGREGYPPVAFVFTGKTADQRESRMRRLEDATRRYFAGVPYPGSAVGITAINYHQAVPVIVTELERMTADGAGGSVWRRLGREQWQTLGEALDNPDGDSLFHCQDEAARAEGERRRAAEREARRPVCARCGAKFTDERWEETTARTGAWKAGDLSVCGACRADDVAWGKAADEASRQTAPVQLAPEQHHAQEPGRLRSLFRRRP